MSSSDLSPLLRDYALHLAEKGDNFVITGGGGVGKTHLIHEIKALKRRQFRDTLPWKDQRGALQCVAPTGLAALHIHGRTIHNLMGWSLTTETLAERIRASSNPERLFELSKVRTIILDEVSMADVHVIMCMEIILARLPLCKGKDGNLVANGRITLQQTPSEKPFGDRQIIVVGDWAQLPPVLRDGRPDHHWALLEGRGGFQRTEFEGTIMGDITHFFELPFFEKMFPFDHIIHLTKCWRQEDADFVALLNRVRLGRQTKDDCKILDATQDHKFEEDQYKDAKTPYPEDLVRATRLYCTNVNVDKENQDELKKLTTPEVRFRVDWSGKSCSAAEQRKMEQVIHFESTLKRGAQVMVTVNTTQWNIRGIKNGSRGVIVGFLGKKQRVNELTLAEEDWEDTGDVPVVKFLNGAFGITPLVTKDFDDGKVTATYYPLRLGWAATAHSSQGMTLDLVHAMVKGCFAFGQFYVMVSRVRSLQGLRLVGFTEECIKTDPTVVAFYEKVEEASRELLERLVAAEAEATNWPPAAEEFDFGDSGDVDIMEGIPEGFDDAFVLGAMAAVAAAEAVEEDRESPTQSPAPFKSSIVEINDMGIQVDLLEAPPLVLWKAVDGGFVYDEEDSPSPRKRSVEEIESGSDEEDEERPRKTQKK